MACSRRQLLQGAAAVSIMPGAALLPRDAHALLGLGDLFNVVNIIKDVVNSIAKVLGVLGIALPELVDAAALAKQMNFFLDIFREIRGIGFKINQAKNKLLKWYDRAQNLEDASPKQMLKFARDLADEAKAAIEVATDVQSQAVSAVEFDSLLSEGLRTAQRNPEMFAAQPVFTNEWLSMISGRLATMSTQLAAESRLRSMEYAEKQVLAQRRDAYIALSYEGVVEDPKAIEDGFCVPLISGGERCM